MALGLDREGAARPDQDVVDVAAPEPDAVEDVPIGPQAFEDRADLALARRTPSPAGRHRFDRAAEEDQHQ